MALLFWDAFPYATAQLTTPLRYTSYTVFGTGAGTIESVGGRFNGRYMRLGGSTSQGHYVRVTKNLGVNLATFCLQFGYRGPGYASPILYFLDGSNEQIHLVDDAGTFKFYNGATLLATASAAHSSNTWHQIEIKVVINGDTPATGSVLLKCDRATLINESNLDTAGTANNYLNAFAFNRNGDVDGQQRYVDFSDIIAMDTNGSYCNDLLGNRRVRLDIMTAEGTNTGSTPSTGTREETINEIPPDAADYNTLDADTECDTFTGPSIPNANATIDAVCCSPYCATDDGGAAGIKGVVLADGDYGYGNKLSVPSSPNWLGSVIYVNPHTSAPFTVAEYNAAEKGYKRDDS